MIYIVVLLSFLVAVAVGYLAAAVSYNIVLVIAVAVIAGLFAFFSPKLSLVLLIFSMLLSPEIGIGAVTGGRSAVLRYDDVLVIIMFFSWLARSALMKDKPFVTDTPVQTPIILYTFVCILSTAFAVLRNEVRFETAFFYVLKYVEFFLIYFMTVNIVDSKEEAKNYLKYGLWVALIVTVYAYYFYAHAGAGARAGAPFEAPLGSAAKESEPASLGGYYLVVFGLLLSLLTEVPDRLFFQLISLFAFMFPAFLITYSRASYIGFAAMLLVFFARVRKRRLQMAVFTGLAILSAGFMPGVYKNISGISSESAQARQLSKSGMDIDLYEHVKNRIAMTYTGEQATEKLSMLGKSINLEQSAFLRYFSLRRVLKEKLPVHPVLGWGVTGVGLCDTQFALVLGETGLLGFMVFLWLLCRIFRTALSVYKTHSDPWVKGLAFGLVLTLTGLVFQGLGVNTFIIVRIMEPFWFLTALVMALHRGVRGGVEAGPAIAGGGARK